MVRRSSLKASDDDRERVADRLRNATAEGRLSAEELEDRLAAVFSARTYGELDPAVRDLPTPREPKRRVPLWAKVGFAISACFGALVAVALAALLLAAVAGVWLTWVVVAWALLGKGRGVPVGGHSRILAMAVRHARAGTRVPRGRRVSL